MLHSRGNATNRSILPLDRNRAWWELPLRFTQKRGEQRDRKLLLALTRNISTFLTRREKIVTTISLLLLHVRSPHYTNVYELHGVYSQTLLACTDRL